MQENSMQKKILALPGLVGCLIAVVSNASPVYSQEPSDLKHSLVQNVQEYVGGYMYRPLIIKDLVVFDMSNKWWVEWNKSRDKGIGTSAYLARGIYEFGKEMGWDDPGKFEKYSSSGTKAEKKKRIQKVLDNWKTKFSLTYKVEDPDFDSMSFGLASRYLSSMGGILSHKFRPKNGEVHITMVLSSKTKKVAVTSKDGKNITVNLPLDFEPTQWDDKITSGLKRFDKDTL